MGVSFCFHAVILLCHERSQPTSNTSSINWGFVVHFQVWLLISEWRVIRQFLSLVFLFFVFKTRQFLPQQLNFLLNSTFFSEEIHMRTVITVNLPFLGWVYSFIVLRISKHWDTNPVQLRESKIRRSLRNEKYIPNYRNFVLSVRLGLFEM